MTPGEPPAQLDDPLADLVVDVPQVRGELVEHRGEPNATCGFRRPAYWAYAVSCRSCAATRSIRSWSARRATQRARCRRRTQVPPRQRSRPLGGNPSSYKHAVSRLEAMQAVADWCWARCGLDCVGGLAGDASPAAGGLRG
jgi:hypothetical protein